MTTLDEFAPNYARAVEVWPTAKRLAQYQSELESAVENNEHGQTELIKAFVECVCTTVCVDRGVPVPEKPKLQDLLRRTLDATGNRHPKDSSELSIVLGAFNQLCDALSRVRNKKGTTAHGRDGFLEGIAADHARVFLHVGDLLVGAVIDAHQATAPEIRFTRDPHSNFEDLNALIDELAGVEVAVESDDDTVIVLRFSLPQTDRPIELRLQPSQILYDIDRELYLQALELARATPEQDAGSEPAVEPEPVADGEERGEEPQANESAIVTVPRVESLVGSVPLVQFATGGDSGLSSMRTFAEQLVQQWEGHRAPGHDQAELVSSLLATASAFRILDWDRREDVMAGMRVSLRRALTAFAVPRKDSQEIAESLVSELLAQRARGDGVSPEGDK